jgi:four helix bundle protein
MSISNLNDFKAWQKARGVCKEIHSLILANNRIKDLSFKDQLSRSSGSVMDNLAEGLGRNTHNEFVHFLSISLGSLMEVKSQLYRSFDRTYITMEELQSLIETLDEINRMVVSLILKLKGNHPENRKRRF